MCRLREVAGMSWTMNPVLRLICKRGRPGECRVKVNFLTISQLVEKVGGWDGVVDVLSMAWALLWLG